MGGDLSEWMEDVLARVPGNENKRDVLRGLLPGRRGKEDQLVWTKWELPGMKRNLVGKGMVGGSCIIRPC